MRIRAIGAAALALGLAACGGGESETGANLTNTVAENQAAEGGSDAQKQVTNLPEGQRNGVLFRAIRDANLTCQHVESSSLSQTSNNVPVYLATCEDGAVYAVAIADDGTATVQSVTPAQGR